MSETSPLVPRLVRFGVFELDLRSGELRKSGARLSLQQQPLQLLAVLLERPGELVTRDELRKRLWPDDTFVDFEHGLNAAVKRLRDTLGDSADSPRFVETVPRRGYRFIAPASVDGAHRSHVGSESAIRPVALPRVRRVWLLLTSGLALGIGGLWIYLSADRPVRSTSPLTAVPFTALPGQEVAPAFSPDGSQIAFAWAADGPRDEFDLYVKVIGRENLLRLTSRPAEFISPAWSPDGRQIAFARLAPGDSAIYLISPLGGPERKLADAALRYYVQAMLSWSPDGKSLAFFDRGPSGQEGVSQIDITTLEKRWWGSPSPECAYSCGARLLARRRIARRRLHGEPLIATIFCLANRWRRSAAGGARGGGFHGHDLDRGRWESDLCRRRRSVARRRGGVGWSARETAGRRGHAGSLPRRQAPGLRQERPSQRQPVAGRSHGADPARRSAGKTTVVQPDARVCGLLARRPPGDVHIRPLGVVGDLDQ